MGIVLGRLYIFHPPIDCIVCEHGCGVHGHEIPCRTIIPQHKSDSPSENRKIPYAKTQSDRRMRIECTCIDKNAMCNVLALVSRENVCSFGLCLRRKKEHSKQAEKGWFRLHNRKTSFPFPFAVCFFPSEKHKHKKTLAFQVLLVGLLHFLLSALVVVLYLVVLVVVVALASSALVAFLVLVALALLVVAFLVLVAFFLVVVAFLVVLVVAFLVSCFAFGTW